MAEKTTGVYHAVTIPVLYEAFQNLLGGKRARQTLARDYFPNLENLRVLEVGCGPATWYPQMRAAAEYVGVDWNDDHITNADRRFGSAQARFICGDVAGDLELPREHFDVVFAFGLLHHLNDDQVGRLLSKTQELMKPGAILLVIEPVYHPRQHLFAKWMKDIDSGQNIRSEDEYIFLLSKHFMEFKSSIRTDALRIPYSHCILRARRGAK